jgi:hypothetical protein
MAWQLLAIWIIVAATIVWFVRDERRAAARSLRRRAESFATNPAWRHRSVGERLADGVHDNELVALHRKFAEELRRQER